MVFVSPATSHIFTTSIIYATTYPKKKWIENKYGISIFTAKCAIFFTSHFKRVLVATKVHSYEKALISSAFLLQLNWLNSLLFLSYSSHGAINSKTTYIQFWLPDCNQMLVNIHLNILHEWKSNASPLINKTTRFLNTIVHRSPNRHWY